MIDQTLLWLVGLSAAFCLCAVGIAVLAGIGRRHDRRLERRDERDG